ncbi:hypothetical protein [Laspinema olomoucense]|uniref:hypothetical protein n=1 Tax=Laspinema olomoucense TaxID=3231600 RepID=UPI0021BB4EC2|nr:MULTISPECIES: hypothetical protein [unclassified Laspinema]MCT7996273.1 hypothetical protein [Laspinema sp. D3c]
MVTASTERPRLTKSATEAIAPGERCGAMYAATIVVRIQPKGADAGWKPRPTYSKTDQAHRH